MLEKILLLQNWARLAGFVTIFVSIIVCSFLYAISYPPVPSSGPTIQGYNGVSSPIDKHPSTNENAKAQRDERERLEKAANERGLTVGTWSLVFVTLFLVLATAVLGIATFIAAIAAKQAAEHIPRVERAYLFVVVNDETFRKPLLDAYVLANSTNQDSLVIAPLSVEFSFENQGKTPAVVREISASISHLSELPPAPTYIADLRLLPKNLYVAPSKPTEKTEVSLQGPVSYRGATSICGRGDSFIWFFGRILYDDIFGNAHEHAFVWRFSMGYFLPYYGNEKYIRNT